MFASPEILVAYFTRLGMLTHTWALVETGLDNIVHIAFEHLGGAAIHRRQPRVLEKKLEYLRDWHEQLPGLGPYRIRGCEILDRITRLSVERHFYVHGFAIADFESKFAFTVAKVDPDPFAHRTVFKESDLDEMLNLVNRGNDLCSDVALYNRELIMRYVQK